MWQEGKPSMPSGDHVLQDRYDRQRMVMVGRAMSKAPPVVSSSLPFVCTHCLVVAGVVRVFVYDSNYPYNKPSSSPSLALCLSLSVSPYLSVCLSFVCLSMRVCCAKLNLLDETEFVGRLERNVNLCICCRTGL